MTAVPIHVRKWWDIANDRRQRLINKKHVGRGLTKAQESELEMLQDVAEAIIDYVSPDRTTLFPLAPEISECPVLCAKGKSNLAAHHFDYVTFNLCMDCRKIEKSNKSKARNCNTSGCTGTAVDGPRSTEGRIYCPACRLERGLKS